MSRGDRREPIFKDTADRQRFFETLGEVAQKTGWLIHAYCLMPNHFHLVVETPNPNLVAGMKWLLGTYTMRFNRRHGLCGHLFGGRYKALLVDGSGSGYVRTVCEYVHLNPARAHLLDAEKPLSDFPWSSYPFYLRPPADRPSWLRVGLVLSETGLVSDSRADRKRFAEYMENRRQEEEPASWQQLRRDWCHGSDQFKNQLLEQMASDRQAKHHGGGPPELSEHEAERIIRDELAALQWQETDLSLHPKTAQEKLRIARRLRRDTVMPLRWIANRLQMGSEYTLRNALHSSEAAKRSAKAAKPLVKKAETAIPQPLPAAPETQEFRVGWD